MEPLLWKFDDALRFVHHPDHPVRSWALELMINRFPERAGDAVVDLLDDDNTYIVMRAADFLADTGDRQRYGPALLERLKQCTDERSGYYAEALGKLGYRQALPLMIDRLRPDPLQLKHSEFIRHVGALGALGGDEARQALWSILDTLPVDAHALHHVAHALLEAGLPDDVDRLVQRYRDWLPTPYRNRMLAAFASACNVDRLYDEMKAEARHGFNAMGRRAAEWLGQLPRLSGESLDLLGQAIRKDSSDVFNILSAEAQRLVEARGDDVAGWRAAWRRGESPPGYRRQVLMTLALLQAFATRPASRAQVRRDENVMGFAMLCQLSVDRDDLARLEQVDDQAETLLAILSDDRQYVLPDIVERVAALGPSIAPRLIEMIDPDSWSWGTIRIVETIAQLARKFPGSCDEAVPLLVETVDDEQGDYLLEACETALVAIGPAAVEALAEGMRDDDISRQIYLTGALARIPTERAARELIDWIESSDGAEEYQIEALKDIGHLAAIDLLDEWWEPGDYLLSEALLVLCEVNGIQAPELPEWRDDVAEQDEEIEQAMSEARGPLFDLYPPDLDEDEEEELEAPLLATRTRREPGQPKQRPAGKHREVSKKEKKRRAAQKKKAKKKKK